MSKLGFTSLACPKCGAPMTLSANYREAHCSYCNSDYIVDGTVPYSEPPTPEPTPVPQPESPKPVAPLPPPKPTPAPEPTPTPAQRKGGRTGCVIGVVLLLIAAVLMAVVVSGGMFRNGEFVGLDVLEAHPPTPYSYSSDVPGNFEWSVMPRMPGSFVVDSGISGDRAFVTYWLGDIDVYDAIEWTAYAGERQGWSWRDSYPCYPESQDEWLSNCWDNPPVGVGLDDARYMRFDFSNGLNHLYTVTMFLYSDHSDSWWMDRGFVRELP